jgi:methylmalonyl-CoA/ethylmalonyl-CoA epimerase
MTLHHVGLAVDSIASHAEHYRQALGIELSGDIVEDEIQRVRVAFAPVGPNVFIEFVEPLDADSPIARVLKNGGGVYHLCYLVPNIEAAIERVRRAGGRLVSGPTPARAFAGRRIAWVYTSTRTLLEFLEESPE